MIWNELRPGDNLPDHHSVARYCFPRAIRKLRGEQRVTARAFERGKDKRADVSVSVMDYFRGSDEETIVEICKNRGQLKVHKDGKFIRLNVGRIVEHLREATRHFHPVVFTPARGNPAHATIVASNLQISVALAVLTNQEGELFPVPNPIPAPS